jgi:hypothetical protein
MQILMILSLICFVLAALEVKIKGINLIAAGLTWYVMAAIAGTVINDYVLSPPQVWILFAVLIVAAVLMRNYQRAPK